MENSINTYFEKSRELRNGKELFNVTGDKVITCIPLCPSSPLSSTAGESPQRFY
jgi:hypothetical protein